MTTELTAAQLQQHLAKHIPLRNEAVRIVEEMETAFKAEAAELYTREKYLKSLVEDLKTSLRIAVAESGEKVAGVTLARVNKVVPSTEDTNALVAWCCKYAPTLLTLKGDDAIRKWYFASPIQNINVQDKPASVLIVTTKGEDGVESQHVVPCPFHMVEEVQVRISEDGIVTAADQATWEAEHE